MTENERKKLTQFFKTLFDPADAVGFSLLPVKGGNGRPSEKVLPFPDFLKAVFAPYDIAAVFPCFTPNPQTKGKTRAEANTQTLNAVFVDIDGGELPALAEKAHLVLSRDETHHHLYFLIDRLDATPTNKKLVRELAEKIIAATGADKAVKDPARVLRIPFFDHVKNGKRSKGYEIKAARKLPRYSLAGLQAELPETKKPETINASKTEYVKQSYLKRGTVHAGDGRSRVLFFIGLDCHGWGIDEKQAIWLAGELNKEICNPPEDAATVAHQVKSAYKYRKAPFGDFATAEGEKDQRRKIQHFEEVARVRDMFSNHVYVIGAEMLINRDTRQQYTTEKQQNLYIAHACATRLPLSTLLYEHALTVADKLDFRPDVETDLYEESGLLFYNRFRPFEIGDGTGEKTHAKRFKEHLRFLTTSPDEYKTLLSFLAFMVQNPGKKVSWAPLIISQNHGVGKSILELLFRNIFGREYVTAVEGYELSQPHTDFLTDKLLVIGEEIELGEKNAMPRLRSLITRDSYRNIAKYQRTYDSSNVANFLFFSNRIDALRIDRFDRRLFVVFNRKAPQPAEYYSALAESFTDGAADIFHFLQTVDLAGFNPNDRPHVTEGKELLIEQSKSEVELFLGEELANKSGEFAYPVVSIKAILSNIQTYAPESVKRFCGQKAVQYFLNQNGFKSKQARYEDPESGEMVTRRVWFLGREEDLAELVKERLRMQKEEVEAG